MIQKSADAALKVAKETFNLSDDEESDLSQAADIIFDQVENKPDQVVVDLGNGQTAKVTMPVPVEVP